MTPDVKDIQLKFDGTLVRELGGAPAELVADALLALQRMVHLIGMGREGQSFGLKARPNAKVRRDYAVICRAPAAGSHLQPFDVASASGAHSEATAAARLELLKALRAFDSDDDQRLAAALPNVRQRWFLADAAQGLLPREGSNVHVSVRVAEGRRAFFADRARGAIQRARAGEPPALDREAVVGKLKALDFATTHLTLKPMPGRQVRALYPLKIEPFLQRNVRRRLKLVGVPTLTGAGDVVGFSKLTEIVEVEAVAPKIERFRIAGGEVSAVRAFGYLIGYDLGTSAYFVRDSEIGLDVFSDKLEQLDAEVRSDLEFLWRTYGLAEAGDLTPTAKAMRTALRARFQAVA